MMRNVCTLISALLLTLTVMMLGGCSSSTRIDDHDHDHGLAWLWVSYPDETKLAVYHSEKGAEAASFTAVMHGTYGVMAAGPQERPALWMAGNHTIYAFTTGFAPHGDHADMETPRVLHTIANPGKPVHMARSVSGDIVAFANDDSSTVSIVDARSGTVTRVSHGSPHSSLVLAGSRLLTAHAQQRWIKIVDWAKDSVLDSIGIGENVHGNAWHEATQTAFFPCLNEIEVIDVAQRTRRDPIAYTQPGRTPVLYHGIQGRVAVGLHRIEGTTDKLLLVDMQERSLSYLTAAPGAMLPQRNHQGRFAMADNGLKAAVSDSAQANIYVIDIDPTSPQYQSVKTLPAPAAACAIATNHDGSIVWALSNDQIYTISVDHGEIEGSFAVAPGARKIFATSVEGEVYEH